MCNLTCWGNTNEPPYFFEHLLFVCDLHIYCGSSFTRQRPNNSFLSTNNFELIARLSVRQIPLGPPLSRQYIAFSAPNRLSCPNILPPLLSTSPELSLSPYLSLWHIQALSLPPPSPSRTRDHQLLIEWTSFKQRQSLTGGLGLAMITGLRGLGTSGFRGRC